MTGELVHHVPPAAIVSIVVRLVLLFGRLWHVAGDDLDGDRQRLQVGEEPDAQQRDPGRAIHVLAHAGA